jgi:ribosome maturation factor RimP
MDLQKLEIAVAEALENQEAYLVELQIAEGNNITVYADADGGISVQKLKMISRQVEAAFDREIEDFALVVSSPGLGKPFRVHRQYTNNIGRWVKVKTTSNEKLIGELIEATTENITLSIPAEKKKEEPTTRVLAFDEIIETKIEIRF